MPSERGAVTRFLSTQHYSSYYLYVEHEGGNHVTLIDVSKTTQPVILAEIPSAANGGAGSLCAVTGTAALITEPAISGRLSHLTESPLAALERQGIDFAGSREGAGDVVLPTKAFFVP